MRFIALLLCLLAAIFPARAQSFLDPNSNPFPRASQHDFSQFVPAPAGQKGFLRAEGNQFFWADGTRAKFWGVNVANTSLFVSEAQIEAMLRNFRAAGFNLVRLHHFDERGGILNLDAPTSGEFVPERLRKLDFWIAKARENGIYVYLDLLDYRRFKAGDGVPNAEAIGRSAKPYAVFDPRLIQLQKDYARRLLREHKNEFTGLAYADDPTIVMLEIYSESGLFMRRGLWRSMPAPYAQNFKKLWNEWLQKTYGTSAKLRAAWRGANGEPALYDGESLETGTVEVPALTWETNRLSAADLPFAAPARRGDGARFAAQIHQKYFAEMRDFLRGEVGFRAPVCVTGRYDDLTDISSQAAELDFIGCNFYYDHPYWGTGKPQWQLPSYFTNSDPLADQTEKGIAAALGIARVKTKPFVVREWNYCWPNQNRATGMLEAATFACLQDFDAMILFTYGVGASAKTGYFDLRTDPVRWGMAAVGARLFLGDMISPAKREIVVPWNESDVFSYEKYHQPPIYNAGWTSRISNDFFRGETYLAPQKALQIVWPRRQPPASPGVFQSDTGQITRNVGARRLTVKGPQVQIYAGNLRGVSGTRDGLGLKNAQSGAIVAISLDGLPLSKSQKWLLKMASDARNTSEKVGRDPRFAAQKNGQWILEDWGEAPVISTGKKVESPLEISLGGRRVLRLWSAGSAWELYYDGKNLRFWSDFKDAKFALAEEKSQTVGSS